MPRILNPVVLVLDALPGLCADAKLAAYIKSMWGGVEDCRRGTWPRARVRIARETARWVLGHGMFVARRSFRNA